MKKTNRIVFIDTNVMDYQDLISQLPFDSDIVRIYAEQNGVVQMLAALQERTSVDAIDIISYGKPGALMLGSGELNSANLAVHADLLTQMSKHLNHDSDILLHDCEVAQGQKGQVFIEQLVSLTGANVAVSTCLIGAVEFEMA